jgi:DNA-binding FadR family transcriptional regulator
LLSRRESFSEADAAKMIDDNGRRLRVLASRSPNVASAVILGLLGEIGHQHSLLARKRRSAADMERFSEIGHQMRSELVDLIAAGDADRAEALWRDYLIAGQRVVGRELPQTRVDVLS